MQNDTQQLNQSPPQPAVSPQSLPPQVSSQNTTQNNELSDQARSKKNPYVVVLVSVFVIAVLILVTYIIFRITNVTPQSIPLK